MRPHIRWLLGSIQTKSGMPITLAAWVSVGFEKKRRDDAEWKKGLKLSPLFSSPPMPPTNILCTYIPPNSVGQVARAP